MGTKRTIAIGDLWQELVKLKDMVGHLSNTPRLHPKDIMRRYNISEATLYRWIRKKLLPRPRRITGRLWTLADLEKAERSGQLPCPVSA